MASVLAQYLLNQDARQSTDSIKNNDDESTFRASTPLFSVYRTVLTRPQLLNRQFKDPHPRHLPAEVALTYFSSRCKNAGSYPSST